MYYTDNLILPENMAPLIITAAPYGPEWLPGDADIPLTWDEQVQTAVDCYNAGATMLHVHVRDPATGQGSVNFDQYNYLLGRLKQAVPKMILQVGGSISFAPHTAEAKAKWLNYDTRHMLAELDPKPEYVTVATGTTQWDVVSMFVPDDIKGTHLDNNPQVQAAWAGMWVDAGPAFYLEHLKRLAPAQYPALFRARAVHQLEIIERLIRAGVYMGPLNMAICGYGGGTLGRNPYHWMDFLRAGPAGRGLDVLVEHARTDLALRDGDRARPARARRQRGQSLGSGQEAPHLGAAGRGRRAHLRGVRPQGRDRRGSARIMKVGVWYNSVEETLIISACRRTAATATGLPGLGHRRQEDGRQGRRRFAPDGLLHGAARGGQGGHGRSGGESQSAGLTLQGAARAGAAFSS